MFKQRNAVNARIFKVCEDFQTAAFFYAVEILESVCKVIKAVSSQTEHED